MPARCHSCCAGSGLQREQESEEMEGEDRECRKNSFEKRRGQLQELINEGEYLCCVDRVQYQLGLCEALMQLQK